MAQDLCTPVNSTWIKDLMLVQDALALEFHNGFCCRYPSLDANWYDLLLIADKGKFQREFIYKQFPYVPIACPCAQIMGAIATPCQSFTTPPLLTMSTTAGAGAWSLFGGVQIPLRWNAAQNKWLAQNLPITTPGGQITVCTFYCGVHEGTPAWLVDFTANGTSPAANNNILTTQTAGTTAFLASGTILGPAGSSLTLAVFPP
jgi:hypothetical protein